MSNPNFLSASAMQGPRSKKQTLSAKNSQAPETHCTRTSPLPLLPSGPGGVGGIASRGADARHSHFNRGRYIALPFCARLANNKADTR